MNSKISSRNYILFAVFAVLTSKMMSLPHVIYDHAHHDAILSVLLNLGIELLLIFLITRLIIKHPKITFIEYLSGKITRIGAGIVVGIISVFLFFKALYILQETYSFLLHTIYIDLPPLLYYLPAFFVTGYISIKGLQTMGKCVEIFIFFLAIGLFTAFINTIGQVPLDTNLPYLRNGIGDVLNGTYNSCFYIGNSLVLLAFMGKVRVSQHMLRSTMLSCVGVGLFVSTMDFCFYNMLGNTVIYSKFAISDITQFNPFVSDLGHLNWLSIIVSTVNLLSIVTIMFYAVQTGISQIYRVNSKLIPVVSMCVIIYIVAHVLHFDLNIIEHYAVEYGKYFALAILVLTIIMLIILNCLKRSGYEKNRVIQSGNYKRSRFFTRPNAR